MLNIPDGTKNTNHIVSIVGYGAYKEGDTEVAGDASLLGQQYWIVRNSWGEYWGELGFFRLHMGDDQAAIEEECVWATPNTWTENNYPCEEDGAGCLEGKGVAGEIFV